jgi:hypothetical protein
VRAAVQLARLARLATGCDLDVGDGPLPAELLDQLREEREERARRAEHRSSAPIARQDAGVLRRSRFADVISRQLDMFEREEADLIWQCVQAERTYDRAERDEAEERYGEFVDLVETGTEALADLRWSYAATLDEDAAVEYEEAFNRAVKKRLPRFGNEIDLR